MNVEPNSDEMRPWVPAPSISSPAVTAHGNVDSPQIRGSFRNDRCTRQERRMRIGVLLFVLFSGSVAVARNDPLWALWALSGLVPFGLLCRVPADVRRLSRQFFGP